MNRPKINDDIVIINSSDDYIKILNKFLPNKPKNELVKDLVESMKNIDSFIICHNLFIRGWNITESAISILTNNRKILHKHWKIINENWVKEQKFEQKIKIGTELEVIDDNELMPVIVESYDNKEHTYWLKCKNPQQPNNNKPGLIGKSIYAEELERILKI